MKASHKTALLLAICSSLSLTSCASVREKLPFVGSKDSGAKAKSDGRIPVLGLETELGVDEAAKGSSVEIPAAISLSQWNVVGGVVSNAPQNLAGDGKLSIEWKRKFGSGASKAQGLIAPPIIGDDVIYTIDADFKVHANQVASGKTIWTKHFSAPLKKGWFNKAARAMGGGLAYENDMLVVSSGFGEILGLDAKSGDVVWRVKTSAPVHSAPLISNNRVYVVSIDSVLWALDVKTGDTLWTQSSLPESARVLAAPSSAISGDTVVTPFSSGEIIASLVANGRKLWSEGLTRAGSGTSLSSINDIAGRPVIHGGVVYAVSQSGIIAAVDLRTGTKIWDKGISSIQTPWVAGEFIFVVSTDSVVYCLRREDGAVVWLKQLTAYENEKKRKNRISWTGPVMVSGNLVMASSKGQIIEMRPADGEILNNIKTNQEFLITPAYKDGSLYFYSNSGEIVALK